MRRNASVTCCAVAYGVEPCRSSAPSAMQPGDQRVEELGGRWSLFNDSAFAVDWRAEGAARLRLCRRLGQGGVVQELVVGVATLDLVKKASTVRRQLGGWFGPRNRPPPRIALVHAADDAEARQCLVVGGRHWHGCSAQPRCPSRVLRRRCAGSRPAVSACVTRRMGRGWGQRRRGWSPGLAVSA